jgi:predicted 3-demethylubiquinone-9 3-methyltransferase (glyoxalase superfamily)
MGVTPCLWFDGNAHEAVRFYLSVFADARRTGLDEGTDDGDSSVGVSFELLGTPFVALNVDDTYKFTPAVSFMIPCADQAEVDHYWDHLVEGGEPSRCGWLVDRFGVSWQVVPNRLPELLGDPDPDRAGRALQAMLTMQKLDIAALEAAADG